MDQFRKRKVRLLPFLLRLNAEPLTRAEEKFKKEAKAKAKEIETQRSKENEAATIDKFEKQRKKNTEEGQTQTK